MNILWDFRLFSYDYGNRGIGSYARLCTKKLLSEKTRCNLFIWGDPKKVPSELYDGSCRWIEYQKGNWKKDLFVIPLIIQKYKIDLFHYWVYLGPLFYMGAGIFHGCRVIATIHDLGTEFWKGIPYLNHIRKTLYWKTQKHLIRQTDLIMCNSISTKTEINKLFPKLYRRVMVIYPPICQNHSCPNKPRKHYFIALGGSPNKNLGTTLKAFIRFNVRNPNFRLFVLGDIDSKQEIGANLPKNVELHSMEKYSFYLSNCSGLLFCSRQEGLGIPPIEAMTHGCPLLLSDIPSLREIADGAGRFIQPENVDELVRGMEDITANQDVWTTRSQQGFKRYANLAESSFKQLDGYFSSQKVITG